MKKVQGFTGVEVAVVLVVLAIAGWFAKPALFPGASKRAANSTAATAAVEKADKAQSGMAAASLIKIGEANAAAPESPAKVFISREVPVGLSYLSNPDPLGLLAAEKRRAAVMEGRAEEAEKLYAAAAGSAVKLARERDDALAARREADLSLERAAAAEHARTTQALAAAGVAVVFLALWLYRSAFSLSPELVGRIKADVHAGKNAIDAIDKQLAPRFHDVVERVARLKTPLKPVDSTK